MISFCFGVKISCTMLICLGLMMDFPSNPIRWIFSTSWRKPSISSRSVYTVSKALYTSFARLCDHHVLSCSHKLDSGSGDVCLKVFGVISAGKGNTECLSEDSQISSARITPRADSIAAMIRTLPSSRPKSFFSLNNFCFYHFYILCRFCL